MTMSPRVLRFDRSDEPGSFVLVHVVQGSSSLDLTLTATEGEAAYKASIKQSSLKDLRSKSYQGSDDEWTQIIRRILGQSTEDDKTSSFKLEATATITESESDESSIIITIRKRVQDITQRLGTITLPQSESEIELFNWAGTAASRIQTLEEKTITLNTLYQESSNTVQKLTQQLKDLVRAKDQHETQLLANFAQLLNEKKLKIRNQQRLLATAKVDSEKVSEIQSALPNQDQSNSPRLTKREHDTDDEDEDSEDFEPMDLDREKKTTSTSAATNPHEDTDEDPSTPPEEDGNTTTDESEDEREPEQMSKQKTSPTAPAPVPAKNAPPPRRELPFTRRGAAATKVETPPPPPAGDETGSDDDDEL